MSRSIHTTHRHRTELERADFADPTLRQKRIEQVGEQLGKKHRIKHGGWQGSPHGAVAQAPVSVESIPIRVLDAGPFVHYPAGVEDVRAVLRLLPPGTLDGLTAIRLCLGKEYQRESLDEHQIVLVEQGRFDSDPSVLKKLHQIAARSPCWQLARRSV